MSIILNFIKDVHSECKPPFPDGPRMSTVRPMKTPDSKPTLAVHALILRYYRGQLEGLFIGPAEEAASELWTLPSAVLQKGEGPVQTLKGVFGSEITECAIQFAEFGSFWSANDDGHYGCISLGFLGLIKPDCAPQLSHQAGDSAWHSLSCRPGLKSKCDVIVDSGLEYLRQRINVDTYPLALLPTKFRTKQARQLYSQILGQPVAPRPFKAWLRRRHAVTRTGPGRFTRNHALKHDWLMD